LVEYGIKANWRVLETAAQYSVEQGLTPRLLKLEEVFAPSIRWNSSDKITDASFGLSGRCRQSRLGGIETLQRRPSFHPLRRIKAVGNLLLLASDNRAISLSTKPDLFRHNK
jgi:hypothetical protein